MAERSEPDYYRPPNPPPPSHSYILQYPGQSLSFFPHPRMLSFLLRLDEAMIRFIKTTGELQPSRLVTSEHVDRAD